MKTFRRIIEKNITGKKVLSLFLITNLVYVLMLTVTIPEVMRFANGMKLLDMMPKGYDLDYINALLNALGPMGRATYLYRQLPIDMIYPALFGITYCLVLAFFLKKLNRLNGNLFYFCLLPLLAGLADYLENLGIIILLNTYPNLSYRMAIVTGSFSIFKSAATTVYFIFLVTILIAMGIKNLKSKRK